MLRIIKYFILALFIIFGNSAVAQQTCCMRIVGTQITGPSAPARFAKAAWDSVFTSRMYGGGPLLKCPEIEMSISKTFMEYRFAGTLTVEETPRMQSSMLHMQLVDIHRGSVVKEGRIAWHCVDQRVGACSQTQKDNVMTLAKSFHPLDELIYNYERIPERATIKPEKDPIMAGKKMTVHLTDIRDSKGATPQPWQRILVKAKKGKILNGKPQGEYRVFKVGGGVIDLNYKAPDKCKKDTETITVYNTCVIDPNSVVTPEREIGKKTFEIFCIQGQAKGYLNPDYQPGGICKYESFNIDQEPAVINFKIIPTNDPCLYKVKQLDSIPGKYRTLKTVVCSTPIGITKFTKEEWGLRQIRFMHDPPFGPIRLDFKRNPEKPLIVAFDHNWVESFEKSANGRVERDRKPGWVPMHNNSWPLKDGYYEDFGIFRYSLSIDEEQTALLKKRCLGR